MPVFFCGISRPIRFNAEPWRGAMSHWSLSRTRGKNRRAEARNTFAHCAPPPPPHSVDGGKRGHPYPDRCTGGSRVPCVHKTCSLPFCRILCQPCLKTKRKVNPLEPTGRCLGCTNRPRDRQNFDEFSESGAAQVLMARQVGGNSILGPSQLLPMLFASNFYDNVQRSTRLTVDRGAKLVWNPCWGTAGQFNTQKTRTPTNPKSQKTASQSP